MILFRKKILSRLKRGISFEKIFYSKVDRFSGIRINLEISKFSPFLSYKYPVILLYLGQKKLISNEFPIEIKIIVIRLRIIIIRIITACFLSPKLVSNNNLLESNRDHPFFYPPY